MQTLTFWMVLLAALPAAASSQDLFGFGARGISLGGAVVSNSVGFPAVYYNPAGLVAAEHNEFTLGYQRADFALTLNGLDYEVEPGSNLVIGLNIPIPFGGILENRLALGLGFLMPTGFVLQGELPLPETPYFPIVEHRPQTAGLHMGLGLRIFDFWEVGISVVALAELIGGIDIAPNDQGNLGSTVRDELVADYAPIVGTRISPVEWLTLGVAWHAESSARFEFPITADLGAQFPIAIPLLNVVGIAQYDPMQISTDISATLIDGLLVSAGMTWREWSAFPNPIENTTEPVPPQDPPDFRNTITPRLGAEYSLLVDTAELQFRLGGFLEDSPVRQQVANTNFLDSDRVGVSIGFGLQWEGLVFNLGFQAQFMAERIHTKDEGLVREPSENAGFPTIRHDGSIFVSVFDVGLAF